MPLRYTPIGAVLNRRLDCLASPYRPPLSASSLVKAFHSSRKLQDDADSSDNHYETLDVQPGATPAEIKKSFYRLSKLHHPDVNPSDPHASRRFHRISEAYHILGHAEKRARYDRDFYRRHPHHHRKFTPHSYHSSGGPAGGRPASGLSSYRGRTFQGPPPSFYRSGGWGAQSSKRRAAHEDSTGTTGSAYNPQSNTGNASSGTAGGEAGGTGGMGPGQRPHPQYWKGTDDVPHFDKEGHERTHRRVDERRAARHAQQREQRRRKGTSGEVEEGDFGRLVIVSCVIAVAVMGPAMWIFSRDLFRDWAGGGNRKRKGE
ncbi:DnaJ subfamily A member 3, mitochondrial [Rhypophila decipiens]|uniref:DnaJ subfamily A member 3, mitochondrial n=1 Tax=Rhypophila decipiens TaxID=261697 RepID=A0AAN6Y509_9PEZI|nr:DnaJ subfamily A member 3, mitochondrial [Rhypophila decipiens]